MSSSENIEVGRGIKILSFNISIGDNTQVTDESVKFLRGATEIETGFRDTDGDKDSILIRGSRPDKRNYVVIQGYSC